MGSISWIIYASLIDDLFVLLSYIVTLLSSFIVLSIRLKYKNNRNNSISNNSISNNSISSKKMDQIKVTII